MNNRHEVDLNINGYKYIEPLVNLGSLAIYMALLPLFHLLVFCGARCFRTNKMCHFLSLNLSKAYHEFFVGYQIVFLMCSIVYMCLSKTYYGGYVSATRVLAFGCYLSMFLLASTLVLISEILIVANSKGWWGLDATLKERIGVYLFDHS